MKSTHAGLTLPNTEELNQKKSALEEVLKKFSSISNLDEILLKRPQDWTEAELREVMQARAGVKHNAKLTQELFDKERQWFLARHGNRPAPRDATGKMMHPAPIHPAPTEPIASQVPGGQTMEMALKRVLGNSLSTGNEDDNALRQTVLGLQKGFNRLQGQKPIGADQQFIHPLLKEDGVLGPKTIEGVKKALATFGPVPLEEKAAIGRFEIGAENAQKTGKWDNLATDLDGTFGKLLNGAAQKSPKPQESPYGYALQAALNELNSQGSVHEPLKEDGIIGPKTETAFASSVRKNGARKISDSFANMLGF